MLRLLLRVEGAFCSRGVSCLLLALRYVTPKVSMRIVEGGIFREAEIRQAFEDVANHPGCSISRRINDNISDLKAQISANERGVSLLQQLCGEYGVPYI